MNFSSNLARIRGHTIWTGGLDRDSIIIDAGAHQGDFSRGIIAAYDSRCYMIEANPDLASNLKVKGAMDTLAAALTGLDGQARFIVRENPEASSVLTGKGDFVGTSVTVPSISLLTLMRQTSLSRIDLLKLDIEGAEFDLLADTQNELLDSISQITVEFHDYLPEFRGRGLFEAARSRLEQLGFLCCCMSFRTHGDVLFLNRKRLAITTMAGHWLSTIAPWLCKLHLA